MFVFENLLDLDDRGIQRLLKDIESDSLIVALKGSPQELREKFLKNMSQRAAETLREDLELRGPVRVSQVEAEQKAILQVVRRLADSGEITVAAPGTDDFDASALCPDRRPARGCRAYATRAARQRRPSAAKPVLSAWQRWEMGTLGEDAAPPPREIEAANAQRIDPVALARDAELERLRLEARAAGEAEGRREGWTQGHADGHTAGLASGLAAASAHAEQLRALAASCPTRCAAPRANSPTPSSRSPSTSPARWCTAPCAPNPNGCCRWCRTCCMPSPRCRASRACCCIPRTWRW